MRPAGKRQEIVMADSGIFIGFGETVRGRERQALTAMGEAADYYTRQQQQGAIESFEIVLLEPHGGELSGFILVRGEKSKLAAMRASEEFDRLTTRARLVVEGVGIVTAYLGDGIGSTMAVYAQQVEELT
jgi:hypothetical protein